MFALGGGAVGMLFPSAVHGVFNTLSVPPGGGGADGSLESDYDSENDNDDQQQLPSFAEVPTTAGTSRTTTTTTTTPKQKQPSPVASPELPVVTTPTGALVSFEEAKTQLRQNCKTIKLMFSEKLTGLMHMLNDATLGQKVLAAWGKGEEHMFEIINYVNQVMQQATNAGPNNKKLLDSIRNLRKKSASQSFITSLETEIQDKRKELTQLHQQKKQLEEESKRTTLKKDHASQRQKKRQEIDRLELVLAKDFDTAPLKQQTEANLREIKQAEHDFKLEEDRLTKQLSKLPALAGLKKESQDAKEELKRMQKEITDLERKTAEMNAKIAKYNAGINAAAQQAEEDEEGGGAGAGGAGDAGGGMEECIVCFEELEECARFSPCEHDICVQCFMREAATPPPCRYAECPICRRAVVQVTGEHFRCRVTKDGTVVFQKGKLQAVV